MKKSTYDALIFFSRITAFLGCLNLPCIVLFGLANIAPDWLTNVLGVIAFIAGLVWGVWFFMEADKLRGYQEEMSYYARQLSFWQDNYEASAKHCEELEKKLKQNY